MILGNVFHTVSLMIPLGFECFLRFLAARDCDIFLLRPFPHGAPVVYYEAFISLSSLFNVPPLISFLRCEYSSSAGFMKLSSEILHNILNYAHSLRCKLPRR